MKFRAVSGILFACLMNSVMAQEDFSSWAHYKDITVNTSVSGAGTVGDVAGFPLLVRLSPAQADVFAEARTGGSDIRFQRFPGIPLPYQIDRWDSVSRTAEIWVSVDSVKGNNGAQAIRLYWGKAGVASLSNGNAVFDTSKGFLGVWHMGGAAGSRPNSTPAGVPATPMAATAGSAYQGISVPGVVGLCDTLRGGIADGGTTTPTGTRDYFDVSPIPTFNSFTFSAWSYMPSSPAWARIFDFGNGQALDNIFFAHQAASADLIFDVFPSQDALGTGALVTGQWKFYSVTLSAQDASTGSTMTLFMDGVPVATGSATFPELSRTMSFLGRSNWPDAYYAGKLDEVHISKAGRSADWIKLSYQTQRIGSTVLTFGATLIPVGVIRHARHGASLRVNARQDEIAQDVQGRTVMSNPIQKQFRVTTRKRLPPTGEQ